MPTPSTAIEAVTSRRFLVSAWPWRAMLYLLTGGLVWLAIAVPMMVLGLPWAVMLRQLVQWDHPSLGRLALMLMAGTILIATFGPLVALPVGRVERWRLRLIDARAARSGHQRLPVADLVRWLRVRYREAATWREVAYTILLAGAVPVWYGALAILLMTIAAAVFSPLMVGDGPVSLGIARVDTVGEALPYALLGVALLPAVPYLLALLAGAHAAAARLLVSASADVELRAELTEVSHSRARLVDAFDAERRRIERDLHDGAQQRLVSLTLQLGLARVDVPDDSAAGRALAGAHEQAKLLMAELRELIHGIRPQTLTEVGLPGALRELAGQAPIPVTVRVDLPTRPPPAVEWVSYFVAAEALTNVFKHSDATTATVTVAMNGDDLLVEVVDDGRGAADPARGTGLTGLADRVAVADGRMFLSSPPGGPTVIRVEMPCRSTRFE